MDTPHIHGIYTHIHIKIKNNQTQKQKKSLSEVFPSEFEGSPPTVDLSSHLSWWSEWKVALHLKCKEENKSWTRNWWSLWFCPKHQNHGGSCHPRSASLWEWRFVSMLRLKRIMLCTLSVSWSFSIKTIWEASSLMDVVRRPSDSSSQMVQCLARVRECAFITHV